MIFSFYFVWTINYNMSPLYMTEELLEALKKEPQLPFAHDFVHYIKFAAVSKKW